MNINNRLEEFRKSLGVNHTQMADSIGIERSTWSKYEKEGTKVPDYVIIILNLKYGINMKWLREGEGEMKSEIITQVHEDAVPYQKERVLSDQEIMSELVLQNKRLVGIIERHSYTIENLSKSRNQ